MRSVLGLIGSAVLVVSCGSNSGDALFADVGGATGAGATAGSSHGGSNTNGGGNTGGTGATTSGGSGQSAGMSGSAGTGPNGGNGASGDATGGDGGDNTGPATPQAIYVATTGNDSADCGLTSTAPCQTISQGVTRGVQAARASVYVQAGSYPGVVVLAGGISVVGGFDGTWQMGAHTDAGHQVIIQGGLEAQSQEYVGVWAHELAESAALQNLEIDAPDAAGQKPGSLDGRSSYGIHAVAAKVALKNVDIKAGQGAKGADGAKGEDAVATAAVASMNGGVGANGASSDAFCSLERSSGGPPGTNSCASSPSNVAMTGGKGGDGGARDLSCSGQPQFYNYTAQPGDKGEEAAAASGQTGKGGDGGEGAKVCGPTMPGSAGGFQNGVKGSKAAAGGKVIASFWYANPGGDGATGDNGTGGGGGGGGGGCDLNFNGTTDARGAGGGGGGAGGCAARSGGGGGGGGGSSFGIFAVGSTLSVSNVNISRGSAADGGAGGLGGQGQSGGVGQSGGALHPSTAVPGKGGDGAHGGHAGGGAGGNGGSAFGIALDAESKLSGAATITGGAAGKGGSGGDSAPNAPALERDGNDGDDGNDGALAETFDL
jgi:hypothetical protein